MVNWKSKNSFEVFSGNIRLQVVGVLPRVYLELLLASFEANAKSDFLSKHHLGALHKVVNRVLEHRIIFFIEGVEINLIVRYDLELRVASNNVNHSTILDLLVLHPDWFEQEFVDFLLHENDFGRAASDQNLVLVEEHLAQVFIVRLLESVLAQVVVVWAIVILLNQEGGCFLLVLILWKFDCESIALSVERIHFIVLIVEGFIWEILKEFRHLVVYYI